MIDRNTEARTIVISDAHGCPELISGALKHAGYETGVDRLVYAGDFLDRGSRAEECLSALEAAGAEMLWGNHDVAVLLDQGISPQRPESRDFRERLLDRCEAGEWQVVTSAGNVLISHAGVSVAYAVEWAAGGMEPAALAAFINAEFRREAEACLCGERSQDNMGSRVLGDRGPLWMRPTEAGPRGYLRGVPQVFGHTHIHRRVVDMFACAGLYCIDPGVKTGPSSFALPDWRYAVIDGGRVEIVMERAVSLMAS